MNTLDAALARIEDWPAQNTAAAVISADGRVLASHGDIEQPYRLASVTKPLTAYATLIAIEEGVFALDDPAGPEGSTVRHLLAHTSGLDFSENKVRSAPGTRRIYSNRGFDVLAETLTDRSGIPFDTYLDEAVFTPLGMDTARLDGSAGAGAVASVADLSRFAAELQNPTLLAPQTLAEATSVAFPGLDGVLPGFGAQRPNDWGLGFELRGQKSPHWTGSGNSAQTFGHFGQTGTFLWVDPQARVACVALGDRDFGPWAAEVWPPFSDAVLTALRG
ncbi:beta-lactamase family protein [Microbacterium esteraromaticum]|uniref:Beta-lactamase family protein n=1 Tax=Microbacterium esteraromaticum TaxID=57043 RepID=A0A939IW47_9MICO|nr:serine hydrolase domain-containing protein [Microbacterium esteraromaticum]MBN8206754.1 beta-lactamase family protein [Microbacterium esteraromaticum]MBN8416909.1 beta-lactamase family protein [Microbacterium esteraromaticum]